MNSGATITPLVSVALCTYNGAAYLREQLDTILTQSYSNLEFIIVDDGSTDETVHILKEYATRDSRIQLYENDTNLGFNANFQKAISLCSGEWIAIADQDDIWHRQKLEIMMRSWNQQAVLIHCSSKKFTDAASIAGQQQPAVRSFNGNNIQQLAAKNTVEGHNLLFHHSLKQKAIPFPEKLFYDWWLGAVATVNGGVQWIEQVLVWRRIHEHNTYEKKMAPLLNEAEIWMQHLKAFLHLEGIKKEDEVFISSCIKLLQTKATYKEWHSFILQHRDLFFYYKKGIFAFVSKRKHSAKLARKLAATA